MSMGFLGATILGLAIVGGASGLPAATPFAERPMLVVMKDVACVQAANARKRSCDSYCNSAWEQDCIGACESDAPWETAGACIALCQRSANQCYRDCIDSHNSEVDACPNR
ncbi:MAG TPA: hypothetical protein PLJ34_07430 [Hyphomicrobiales bacterium]|nr:hypothetical protein [Kaistiaceae bacterium]HQF31263.1 hypothetical protein [Hyphomicrobiales bacterium]